MRVNLRGRRRRRRGSFRCRRFLCPTGWRRGAGGRTSSRRAASHAALPRKAHRPHTTRRPRFLLARRSRVRRPCCFFPSGWRGRILSPSPGGVAFGSRRERGCDLWRRGGRGTSLAPRSLSRSQTACLKIAKPRPASAARRRQIVHYSIITRRTAAARGPRFSSRLSPGL